MRGRKERSALDVASVAHRRNFDMIRLPDDARHVSMLLVCCGPISPNQTRQRSRRDMSARGWPSGNARASVAAHERRARRARAGASGRGQASGGRMHALTRAHVRWRGRACRVLLGFGIASACSLLLGSRRARVAARSRPRIKESIRINQVSKNQDGKRIKESRIANPNPVGTVPQQQLVPALVWASQNYYLP